MKNAIIYLHGFNSASLDLTGNLLQSKQKIVVLDKFCQHNQLVFSTPNVDYRSFGQLIDDLMQSYSELQASGYRVVFMGSSLGGFTSEYMAMKTHSKAIMINPAIMPSKLLTQYIGVSENFEIKQSFDWTAEHCKQFKSYESELERVKDGKIDRTIFLDMGDELIDSSKTVQQYKDLADVHTYEGGSHSFEHIEEASVVIEQLIFQ
jgi:hypothetical protein